MKNGRFHPPSIGIYDDTRILYVRVALAEEYTLLHFVERRRMLPAAIVLHRSPQPIRLLLAPHEPSFFQGAKRLNNTHFSAWAMICVERSSGVTAQP